MRNLQEQDRTNQNKTIRNKPSTSYQDKRNSIVKEQGNGSVIKESIVSSIKQTIANEEAKYEGEHSFSSDKPVIKAVLPAMDHERSKRKIDDLLFRPSENANNLFQNSKGEKSMFFDPINKNYQESTLNEMPDLSSYDNRNNEDINRLIGNKMKEHRNGNVPNKSMKNLNLNNETLPIYKRKTNNKGPIKLTNSSYSNKPVVENLTMKRREENTTIASSDENMNEMNQNKGGKGNSTYIGRQRTDFRINKGKNNVKQRTNTANSRRNTTKSTLISSTNLNVDKQIGVSQTNNKNSKSSVSIKSQIPEKRAQSQHNQRNKIK